MVLEHTDAKGNEDSSLICIRILEFLSVYFILLELNQLRVQGPYNYFLGGWNYLETSPLILILINCETAKEGKGLDVLFFRIQAVAALLMWTKFFYFLRSFEASSYLIRSLIEIAKDMWVFALVLSCLVIGLADAFGSVSKSMTLKPEP